MILSEYRVDGLNNSTIMLKQKNHDALMALKYKFNTLASVRLSGHCTLFDSGRIVDVGPGVEMCFDNGYTKSYAVLYGDTSKINTFIDETVKQLKEECNGKEN